MQFSISMIEILYSVVLKMAIDMSNEPFAKRKTEEDLRSISLENIKAV